MGWLKHLCGDREREALECDDYSFSQSSRVTYMASLTVFAAVIGDACMIDRVLALDTTEAPEERVGVGAGTRSARGRRRPVAHGQRERSRVLMGGSSGTRRRARFRRSLWTSVVCVACGAE